MRWLRLTGKLQQFELLVIGLTLLVWAVAVGVVGITLDGFVVRFPDCFGLSTATTVDCRVPSRVFGAWDQTAELLLWFVLAFPIVVGSILAAPIISREIEHGTAQFVWSLSPSRLAWLGLRTVPVVAFATAFFLVAALGGEYLQSVRLAGDDPGFLRFDQRGLLVVTRGLVAFAIGWLLGSLLGKTLPAVLLSLIVSVTVVFGAVAALDAWRRTEAVVVDLTSPTAEAVLRGALIMEPVAILPDGTVTGERLDDLPEGTNYDAVRAIPSGQYGVWLAREAGVHGALVLVTTSLVLVAVRSRRPL